MATIDKRSTSGGVRYDVRYRDPAGKQRKRTFRRRKDADAFVATTEADKIRGTWIDDAHGKVTFAEWWTRYLGTTVNLRASTRARDESYARNHLLPHFGEYPIGAIDHLLVVGWVAEMTAKGLAPATVQKAAQILSKAMGAAVDSGMIVANPCDRVKLPKVERHEMLFLTPAKVATLAEAIDERYRALVLVGAYCGLRFGEMAALTRDKVDLLHRRIEVTATAVEVRGVHHVGPPKTRAGHRSVPIPRSIASALEVHLGATAGDLVFPAPGGGLMRASLFRRRFWQPATVASDLGGFSIDQASGRSRYEGLRIHDLRHTAVALWIAAGASPKEIAARAGHSSVVTVLDRYGHLLPGQEEAVDDALDAMVAASIPEVGGTVCAMDVPWTGSGVLAT